MSDDEQFGPTKHSWGLPIVAALLVIAGVGALWIGLHAQKRALRQQLSATAGISGPILAASAPTNLSIPSIGVSSNLLRLGLNSDHTVQVPPQSPKAQAGWFSDSPTPGQLGPSILLGHVDSAKYGPGVFFKLGALKPGATVTVTRADHTAAVFHIERVVSYSKNDFPTFDVYGNTDHAALRLVTCGGKFDLSKHSYENNIVAYASLVSSHRV
jgi:hypothetical protein